MHEDSMNATIREYIQSVHGATNVAVGRVSSGSIRVPPSGLSELEQILSLFCS